MTKIRAVTRPQGYKTFYMLNSAEHEILNAHMHKHMKKFSIFQARMSLECYYPCSYLSAEISCSAELSMKTDL